MRVEEIIGEEIINATCNATCSLDDRDIVIKEVRHTRCSPPKFLPR